MEEKFSLMTFKKFSELFKASSRQFTAASIGIENLIVQVFKKFLLSQTMMKMKIDIGLTENFETC